MNIVNVMWSGGTPYLSVHKVHREVLRHAQSDAHVDNWLLLGDGVCGEPGPVLQWHLPRRALKQRGFWRVLMPWLRWRMALALSRAAPEVLLLDGIGVARVMLPVMHRQRDVRATVLFHGSSKLRDSDIHLLRALPVQRLRVVAVSQTLAQELEQTLGRPVEALRIAMNPEVFSHKLFERKQARRLLALPEDGAVVFGAVGRLVEGKGFEMLIEAFVDMKSRRSDVRLALIGDGELSERLQARIDALGLGGHIVLCGYRPDATQLYRAFDWILVPSQAEGLGLVVQEAVLADVPVICSDLPVFREQLGEAGHYLAVGDKDAWSEGIERCVALDGVALAAHQRAVMAPEAAWDTFRQASAKLLQG